MKVLMDKTNIKFLEPVIGLEETLEPLECDVEVGKDMIIIKLLKKDKSPLGKMMEYIKNPISCDIDTMIKALEVDDA